MGVNLAFGEWMVNIRSLRNLALTALDCQDFAEPTQQGMIAVHVFLHQKMLFTDREKTGDPGAPSARWDSDPRSGRGGFLATSNP